MTPGQRAESRIAELGIADPRDLDVELIAMDAGMEVRYENLQGCEATLVGVGSRSIATVRRSPVRGRERFSVGHELGHWEMHRGQAFRCRVDEPDQNWVADRAREREADTYASHLLMPAPMFNPAVKERGTPGFHEIEDLAEFFTTSVLATCMRLADINTLPVILGCYDSRGLRWHKGAVDVPRRWWLRQQLDDDSFAYDLLHGGKAHPQPGKQPAEVWFENVDAEQYEVMECCIPGRGGEILVLVYLGPNMLDASYDPEVGHRKYNQHGSYVTRKLGAWGTRRGRVTSDILLRLGATHTGTSRRVSPCESSSFSVNLRLPVGTPTGRKPAQAGFLLFWTPGLAPRGTIRRGSRSNSGRV